MAVARRLQAIIDLQEICDYLYQFSPAAASRFLVSCMVPGTSAESSANRKLSSGSETL